MRTYLLASAVLFLLTIPVGADDSVPALPPGTKVMAPANDVGLMSNGTVAGLDDYELRIGEMKAPGGECYILPFRLPALGPGQHFANVHLRMQMHNKSNEGGALGNCDLYGLGVRDSAKALPTDYYQGPNPDPKATLLQAKVLTPDSSVRAHSDSGPFVETSADGDAALTKYFNDLAQPGTVGKYLFLRISYDVDPIPPGNNAYTILTGGADGDNEPPILTYTIASGG